MKLKCTARQLGFVLSLLASQVHAGVDLAGPVQRVQIAQDGKLWFVMETTPSSTYCKVGWAGFNMYVPKEHPDYPFYYATLMMAVSKGKTVWVPNISMNNNGSEPCDITRTGFGLVISQ